MVPETLHLISTLTAVWDTQAAPRRIQALILNVLSSRTVPKFAEGSACSHKPDSQRETAKRRARSVSLAHVSKRVLCTNEQSGPSHNFCDFRFIGKFSCGQTKDQTFLASVKYRTSKSPSDGFQILPMRSFVLYTEDRKAGKEAEKNLRIPKPPNLIGRAWVHVRSSKGMLKIDESEYRITLSKVFKIFWFCHKGQHLKTCVKFGVKTQYRIL